MDYYTQTQRSPCLFAGYKASHRDSGGVVLSPPHPQEDWQIRHALPSAAMSMAETGLEERMWQVNLQPTEEMEPTFGPYPERPGEPDCVYYLRTGLCGFGMGCRFNHPPELAAVRSHARGEYPERIGQPECQYYLKTGTCKFGATCKYHHPYDKGGVSGQLKVNILGLPLRSGVEECSYYMRTGYCKYGVMCKFHHPQPLTTYMSAPNSSLYASAASPSTPVAQHYPVGMSSWPMTRGPYLASPQLHGHSSFGPLIIPSQGIVSVGGWSNYQQGRIAPVSPDGQHSTVGPRHAYAGAQQAEPLVTGIQGSSGPYSPVSGTLGISTSEVPFTVGQTDLVYPERLGQPECQYYMKTGDCKFGITCRYHHPKDRAIPAATLKLSPMGLPLRSGVRACTYYTRYSICKFGPTCKFDHPLDGLDSSLSASLLPKISSVDCPASSLNTPLIPASSAGEPMRKIEIPAIASAKDSASVSSDSATPEQLASKENFEDIGRGTNALNDTSLQEGESSSIHVTKVAASISSLGTESV